MVEVPLNAMCSNKCATPLSPPGSSTLPTRNLRLAANTGAVPRRAIRNRMPLSRVMRVDRKSTRLNSSHEWISYAVFCLKKKKHRYEAKIDRVYCIHHFNQ